MNARPLLERIARALREAKLEAILIGNAAAALHGAPVTTLGVGFLFRKTPASLRKLKAFARALHASVFQPFHPVSSMYRVMDDATVRVDFRYRACSFDSLRSRASTIVVGREALLVADRACVPRSDARRNRKRRVVSASSKGSARSRGRISLRRSGDFARCR